MQSFSEKGTVFSVIIQSGISKRTSKILILVMDYKMPGKFHLETMGEFCDLRLIKK